MHFDDGRLPAEYRRYLAAKTGLVVLLALLLALALVVGVSLGAAHIPLATVARALLGLETTRQVETIVWNIRLPQALASVVAGAGLAAAGAAMQSILRNPLGSPFTLGISHAAALGAALAVMVLGGGVMTSSSVGAVQITSPWLTTAAAFVCSLIAAAVIVAVARLRSASPEVMILTGVALGAFCTAATMFLQFFADVVELAGMVFWSFGDTARASWR